MLRRLDWGMSQQDHATLTTIVSNLFEASPIPIVRDKRKKHHEWNCITVGTDVLINKLKNRPIKHCFIRDIIPDSYSPNDLQGGVAKTQEKGRRGVSVQAVFKLECSGVTTNRVT